LHEGGASKEAMKFAVVDGNLSREDGFWTPESIFLKNNGIEGIQGMEG
jgi:hypothetical protein